MSYLTRVMIIEDDLKVAGDTKSRLCDRDGKVPNR